MLIFDLRKLLDEYQARTGVRVSYKQLAVLAETSVDTIKSLAARRSYNATLHLIDRIADALGANPLDYLSYVKGIHSDREADHGPDVSPYRSIAPGSGRHSC